MNASSGDTEGAASAAPPIKPRRARKEWKKLSDREKIERLSRDVAWAEARIEELEGELLEADSRVRLLFKDLGRQQRRLRSLWSAYELDAKVDDQGAFVLDYTEASDG